MLTSGPAAQPPCATSRSSDAKLAADLGQPGKWPLPEPLYAQPEPDKNFRMIDSIFVVQHELIGPTGIELIEAGLAGPRVNHPVLGNAGNLVLLALLLQVAL